MARLIPNSPLAGLSGTLGKQIVFKQYAHGTVVSKYPDMSRVKPSPLQLVYRQRLKEATAYAQRINRDPVLRAEYAKGLKAGESVFHKAKKEYLEQFKKDTTGL
ncbi:hypothetical protein SAMN05444008_11817 [Cnuella takakiae]|uniref:Uncharacterized protein n=1 Tax=Cnuella takakiae TaxID=1302690 RepID=A0A1M5H3E4_9BACT|nr:hypothetical protein [Cnuella takakiae]OLY91129.1 hypothetical protein BUE76_03825 [Cnuella takakiae]SHG10541.1 hypothetical protein SAMN05444008_11817 [Cnuella takakiae]